MIVCMATMVDRERLVRRGRTIEWITIGYNCLEGAASLVAGLLAGSVSLAGFGIDSLIEVTSGAALLWRLHHDFDPGRRERAERLSLRAVGGCFLALALYLTVHGITDLSTRAAPEASVVGIVIAALSLLVMPALARAKRRVAAGIGSGALEADARQTDFCMYLSAILLAGLSVNAVFGWWWADPAAALAMAPLIAREGYEGWRGRTCCACGDAGHGAA